jgi:dTDP-4-dehydrorhamnose reductase
LITGSRGMLGTDLMCMLAPQHTVFECDVHNCNILDAAQVDALCAAVRPDVVIHTAAYTNVDQAESDRAAALALNETGTRHVACAAKQVGARFVHISTDYVFNGMQTTPYTETDSPQPCGVYGETKWRAEQQVQAIFGTQGYLIIRTAWLYGQHGKNFVRTILRLAREQKTLRIVHDQTGCPTYTKDLVRGIMALLAHDVSGIIHVVNSGACTWYEFTRTILDCAGLADVTVQPITAIELGRPAPRPVFSVLDTSKFTAVTGHTLPPWQIGLQAFLAEYRLKDGAL